MTLSAFLDKQMRLGTRLEPKMEFVASRGNAGTTDLGRIILYDHEADTLHLSTHRSR